MKNIYAENAHRMAKRMIEAAQSLKTSGGTILVFPHKSVDGDCVGSTCAAVMLFRGLGANAYVCMPEKLPEFMSFLAADECLFYPDSDFTAGSLVNGSPYVMRMSVDCSEGNRMGPCEAIFDSLSDVIALDVDHHEVLHLADDYKWIEPDASSASEMMYYVAVALADELGKNPNEVIDSKTAQFILTGMVTDTGRFTYSNTHPETLISAGELMELGANITDVCYNLFDRKKRAEFLISNTACVNAEFYYDGKVAITCVTEEMFKKFGAGKDDIADVVSRLRDIDGIELAIVLRELDSKTIKGNLRSKNTFDCNSFANNYTGGGHIRAAGFTYSGMTIDELKEDALRKVADLL